MTCSGDALMSRIRDSARCSASHGVFAATAPVDGTARIQRPRYLMDANSPSAALDHGMVMAVTPEGFRRRGDGRGPRLVVKCSRMV